MAEEKKKYVRKKCEHGKYSFQCKDCKGSSFCIHGKYKIYCKICDGKGFCIHDSIKTTCVILYFCPPTKPFIYFTTIQ